MSKYKTYTELMLSEIQECIETMECQPILFIGSGISKRYFNAPSWDELLSELAQSNPLSKEYAYYKQNFKNCIDIGTELSKEYTEWAWGEGRSYFEQELYSESYSADIFIKSKVSSLKQQMTPNNLDEIKEDMQPEIKLLQEIKPHAIITTNYDEFLELVFPEYAPIIGQKILKTEYSSIGEIYKIHGCITEPSSIVLIGDDYREFQSKKKYLSAKLLTYFLEHPIIIFGYGANDPNVQSILSDIDEILASNNQLVPNIFIINWKMEIRDNEYFPQESLLRLENEKSLRIRSITASEFDWIYRALINENAIENVNPKLLRALLSRTYNLIRTDIPRRAIEIDYETLEGALNKDEDISKIFGITTLTNPSAFNISYPYTLTGVANELGYTYWSHADSLLQKIKEEKDINIKSSDNRYHISVKTGLTSRTRKYSNECVELLKKVRDGVPYEVEV